jgi:hypothetical protein
MEAASGMSLLKSSAHPSGKAIGLVTDLSGSNLGRWLFQGLCTSGQAWGRS